MPKLLYIDLFCGAGGTSTGVESARYEGRPCAKVIGCVNHDPNAIASHAANHPDTLHLAEDIRTLDLSPLAEHLAQARRRHPEAFVVLWASLECTNFSKAKGGQPRDADSRTLAEHLFRYIEAIDPDYIQIENVEEFMSWGDLDVYGRPISRDAGRLYRQWVKNVCGYGYRFDHRILNAADYGAYTSRRRFFGIFAKGDLPIVFPEPTHCKEGASGLFGQLKRWKPAREVLDFSDEGESIFGRKKPLVDATLERIYAGLIKFVAGGKEAFLVKWNSMSNRGKYHAPGIEEPCPTVSTQNRLGVAQVSFLAKFFSGNPEGKCISVEGPAGAVTARDHHSFITAYYGNGHNHSIDAPAPTLTTRDRLAFVDMRYGNGTPCLIETGEGKAVIVIAPNDSPAMVKIKCFMALYGIIDIKMRMLRIPELKRIMGFPSDYVLVGTQAGQKKSIGNAVEVNMARVLCETLVHRLIESNLTPQRIAA